MIDTLVVPAAGRGTRMRPLNPDLPKELLPVGDRPAIWYAVAEGVRAGVKTIVVVSRPDKPLIERFFRERSFARALYPGIDRYFAQAGQVDIQVVHQAEPLGEADALLQAAPAVTGHSFGVVYPDNVATDPKGALRRLAEAVRPEHDRLVAMSSTANGAGGASNSGRIRLGAVDGAFHEIVDFLPKGAGAFSPDPDTAPYRICGIYLADAAFLEFANKLRSSGFEGELTDGKVRRAMLARGYRFHGLPLEGPVYDVGNPDGFALCWRKMVGREPETTPPGRRKGA